MTEKTEDELLDEMVEQGYDRDDAARFFKTLLATVHLATSKPASEITPEEWEAAQATKQ